MRKFKIKVALLILFVCVSTGISIAFIGMPSIVKDNAKDMDKKVEKELQKAELPYIIMYKGAENEYKLYIYPTDIHTRGGNVWGGYGTEVGASAQSSTAGWTNTQAIVSAYGENEPYAGKSDYAAKICYDLVDKYKGYDDWYLPAYDQLAAIATAARTNAIEVGLYTYEWKKWKNMNEDYYWSSTEDNGRIALACYGSGLSYGTKTGAAYVRPVRGRP